MRLQLLKTNWLCYADARDVCVSRVDEKNIYSMFTEDWVQVLDAERIEEELTHVWLWIANTPVSEPNINKVKIRGSMLLPQLPTLIRDEEFSPLLEPLAQGRFT